MSLKPYTANCQLALAVLAKAKQVPRTKLLDHEVCNHRYCKHCPRKPGTPLLNSASLKVLRQAAANVILETWNMKQGLRPLDAKSM